MTRLSSVVLSLCCVLIAACSTNPRPIGKPLIAPDGTSYFWIQGKGDSRKLVHLLLSGEIEQLDDGAFSNVLGPLPAGAGIVWAVLDEKGEWRVHQTNVTPRIPRRSQSTGSALSAAWLLERITNGHAPGNAADVAQTVEIARSGRWPQ